MTFSWKWLGIFVGATAILMTLQLAPGLDSHFLPLRVVDDDPERRIRLFVDGGLFTLITPVLLWVVPAAAVGALARRPLHRELLLGGVMLAVVQWAVWIGRVKGEIGPLFGSSIALVTEGGGIVLPPFIGLLVLNVLAVLVAVASGSVAGAIAARARGDARPQDERKTTRWGRVAASALGTAIVFVLFVRFLGPALHFYWACDFNHPGSTCQAGLDAVQSAKPGDFYFWQEARGDDMPGVILDSLMYALLSAPLFAIGPLVIGLTTRRGRGVTGAWAAFLAWPAATLAAMIFLGFAQFDSVIVLSLRLHVLAGIPWCALGFAGVWLGAKFGPKVELAEELGIDLNPPEPARDYRNW